MTHPIWIAPSLLSCDFGRIGEEVRRVERSGGDCHHVDVMDGHFVPTLTIGPPVVKRIREAATIPLDVHLMITEPRRHASDFVRAGAHILTFHIETCAGTADAADTIRTFRDAGVASVAVALNPDTGIELVADILDRVDMVLVMSVHPGYAGQSFRPEVLTKVKWLRERGYAGRIEVDGGVSADTAPLCVEAGADMLVAGSALFGAPDMTQAIRALRQSAEAVRGAIT